MLAVGIKCQLDFKIHSGKSTFKISSVITIYSIFSQTVNYSGPDAGGIPILELEADVSSWEVGDQVVVAATHFDSRESEVFTIVECQGEFYVLLTFMLIQVWLHLYLRDFVLFYTGNSQV